MISSLVCMQMGLSSAVITVSFSFYWLLLYWFSRREEDSLSYSLMNIKIVHKKNEQNLVSATVVNHLFD